MVLQSAGEAVGLPWGVMGNSEVGHLTLGSGRIIIQSYTQISSDIDSGNFFKIPILKKAVKAKPGRALHLIGLLSDAGVHAHIDHLLALIELSCQLNTGPIYLHLITDGRDTAPHYSKNLFRKLDKFSQKHNFKIATIIGRYFAMDRDNRWKRTKTAYDLIVNGKGKFAKNWLVAIAGASSDEVVRAHILDKTAIVKNYDNVIFFNFRADRMVQLASSFEKRGFRYFPTKDLSASKIYSLTQYFHSEVSRIQVIYSVFNLSSGANSLVNPMAQVLSKRKLSQLHIGETEKYAHITYFFNAGREKPFSGEKQVLIPSAKVTSYDLLPQMRAKEIAKKFSMLWQRKNFDFAVINFANADMVGHSGKLDKTIQACNAVDRALARVVQIIDFKNTSLYITADHGNAEQMRNLISGTEQTEHTTNPVFLIRLREKPRLNRKTKANWQKFATTRPLGLLADVAPTILAEMKIAKPPQMTGRNLFDE